MFALITGGSGSGKSEYAENLAVSLAGTKRNSLIYIATMVPFGEEAAKRIERHRQMRALKHFTTKECYVNLKELKVPACSTILLECMSNLTANEMFQEGGAGEMAVEEILQGIERLQRQCRHLVVVTNEIFSDGIDYDEETKRYQRYLAAINRVMAADADQVTEVVYGIPLRIKSKAFTQGRKNERKEDGYREETVEQL